MYSTKRHEYPRMLITMIIVLLWPSGLIKQLINKSNKMLPFTRAVSFWVKIWLINYMGGVKSQVMKLMLSIINCDKPFWHHNYISYFLLRGDNMATGWPVTAQWHYNEIIISIHWYCTAWWAKKCLPSYKSTVVLWGACVSIAAKHPVS